MMTGLIKYHALTLLREPLNIFFALIFPFINVVMMLGFGVEETDPVLLAGTLPVFMMIGMLVLCFTDAGMSHAYGRQIKFLRKLRMTPVTTGHYIISGVLLRIFAATLLTGGLIAFGIFVYNMDVSAASWHTFIPMLLLIFAMFYTLSMFLANVCKKAKTSQNLCMVIMFAMIILLNVATADLPDILQNLTRLIPTQFAIELLVSAWNGTGIFQGFYFYVAVGATILFGLLSMKTFKFE
ncbi:MAG: ABC transporter permease [Defluviitaleaceae bacterium]|nr:ABC transporter permease [Defluviitaleaceae bacterium]